ncbi:MAG: hypothetical protein M3332_17455, partial [Actinomycetota bacterium]|nr:hypothetical protein [Actinomycetota bacterium]
MEFSVGASLGHFDIHAAVALLPGSAWTPAYQARKPRAEEHGVHIEPHDGAWVAEVSALVDLSAWPVGTRLILRKQRPHPGAQLRITDVDGMRITGFFTNTAPGRTRTSARRPQAAPPPPRPRRGPHPRRQRHWAAQPPPPRLRPKPGLAGHRRPSRGPTRLVRPPGLTRIGCKLRTETATAAHPRRRRANHAHRPQTHPQNRPRMALGRRDHHRAHPTDGPTGPLSTNPAPQPTGPGAPAT